MSVNAMKVSAARALDVLKAGWRMQQEAGVRYSWMLHGRPGVGKTQVAEALARHLGGRLYDMRLTQIDTADLRGLPYYDHATRTTQWYRPQDLPGDDAPAVLFLDEITAASPLIQPTVYGLLQERRVGLHRIPDATMIVAAGNSVEDGAVAYEMGSALSDRLIHMVVVADPTDWLRSFAEPRDLHRAVMAFIRARPDMLETLAVSMEAGHVIAATPRSWERVSEIMKHVADREARAVMIAGAVGAAVAADFLRVADDVAALVSIETLLAAPKGRRAALYPETLHGLNALTYGLVGWLGKETVGPALDCLIEIGDLRDLRPKSQALAQLPLRELSTAGMELAIEKALKDGFADKLIAHPGYGAYRDRRHAEGLA
jgi:MoxR-like ATPase